MNILLSYPRSGNTWIRYCIEFLTKEPTLGYKESGSFDINPLGSFINIGVNIEKSPILLKKHETNTIKKIDSLILIIRDYKEVIPRHTGKELNIELLRSSINSKYSSMNYIQLIEYFEDFSGKKAIIYYEDILMDLKSSIEKILRLLNKDDYLLEEFMNSIDEHKKNSLKIYKKSITNGNFIKFHSNKISKNIRVQCDEFLESHYPIIYNKYLKRYEERKN